MNDGPESENMRQKYFLDVLSQPPPENFVQN